MMRYYGWTSLLAIVLTAALIAMVFRHLAIDTLIETGNENGITLATAAVSSFRSPLLRYLEEVSFRRSEESLTILGLPPDLVQGIHRLLDDTSIIRVKIYDAQGRVVFSTKTFQVGTVQADNPGFKSAIGGEPAAKIIYRDTLNTFDKEDEDANLMQAYVPVRDSLGSPIAGVFEVYMDVNDLVAKTTRNGLFMTFIMVSVLSALYGVLMFIVRRSERIIETQYQADVERRKAMEMLTGKMLTAQEDEKKRIANLLHEEIIQTLGGVKMYLEHSVGSPIQNDGGGDSAAARDQMIPVLQQAIRKLRMVAIDLRPSVLDEFGLEATLKSMMSECDNTYDSKKFHLDFNVTEDELPKDRKDIIFRIVKDVINRFCLMNVEGRVKVDLDSVDQRLILRLELQGDKWRWQEAAAEEGFMQRHGFESIREHAIISGGEFLAAKSPSGHISYQASWG